MCADTISPGSRSFGHRRLRGRFGGWLGGGGEGLDGEPNGFGRGNELLGDFFGEVESRTLGEGIVRVGAQEDEADGPGKCFGFEEGREVDGDFAAFFGDGGGGGGDGGGGVRGGGALVVPSGRG